MPWRTTTGPSRRAARRALALQVLGHPPTGHRAAGRWPSGTVALDVAGPPVPVLATERLGPAIDEARALVRAAADGTAVGR